MESAQSACTTAPTRIGTLYYHDIWSSLHESIWYTSTLFNWSHAGTSNERRAFFTFYSFWKPLAPGKDVTYEKS